MSCLVLLASLAASTMILPLHQSLPMDPTNLTVDRSEQNDGSVYDTRTSPAYQEIDEKHELFKSCLKFALDPDEYVLFENGTAYVEVYNKTYNSSFYQLADGKLKVCVPREGDEELPDDGNVKFPEALTYITVAGLIISILCLFLHLMVFCVLREMRNLPSYNVASLALSLLLGYVCFMTSHSEIVPQNVIACTFFGVATQFFMMAAFLWMSTMAFDIYRNMRRVTVKLRVVTKIFNVRKYSLYCLYSWGTPIVFVVVTLVLDNVNGIPEEFQPMIGKDICWFNQRKPLLILFAVPLFLVALMNVVFFSMSAYIIYTNRMKTEQTSDRDSLKKNLIMYFRLSAIMGLTWVVGLVAGVVNAMWLWFAFALLNTLQGFFIFMAFTCTEKVKKSLKQRLSCRSRKMSSQSSAPTFQSYCNSGFTSDSDKRSVYDSDDSPLTMKKIIENSVHTGGDAPKNTTQ